MVDLIPVALIERGIRIREVSQGQVDALVASIREVGLLNPVTVRAYPVIRNGLATDGYLLISGLHRLEAMVSLGEAMIPAHIVELDGPAAILAECDENLCSTVLTPSERALFTKRRKAAYEALHPETKNGATGERAILRQLGEVSADRFTADTAAKTGKSERAVQRDAHRGEHVDERVLNEIRGTDLDTGKTLDALAAVPAEQQVTKLAEIRERSAVKPAPSPLNDLETEEQWMSAIMRVWNRGAPQWRERFLGTVDTPVFDRTGAA